MATVTKKVLDEVLAATEPEPVEDWVWVDIPERDLTDFPFGGIGINLLHFGGPPELKCDCADSPRCKTTRRHKVSPDLGKEISERLAIARAADLRIYTNRRDMKSLIELVKNNPNYQYFDPNSPNAGR